MGETTETVEFQLNGKKIQAAGIGDRVLLWYLRADCRFTGAKFGCGEGYCGACTVLVNGEPTRTCITRVREVAGKNIVTIEGLSADGRLHPVQQAFLEHDAFQCGYCTSGMILRAVAFVEKHPRPSREQIQEGLEGHLCRCAGYQRIIEAVQAAARVVHRD